MAEEKSEQHSDVSEGPATPDAAASPADATAPADEAAAAEVAAALDELAAGGGAPDEDPELVPVAEAAPAGDGATADSTALQQQIEQLQADVENARDAMLRATADAQNSKRRAEQDVEKARKFALERFCSELLPVVDNLERALETAPGEEESVRPFAEGVELTLKSFLDALRKFQIEPVDPHGEPFDPQLHQAMSMVENGDVEPNSVLTVMQKGYTLNGRLVRPAMVIVSKAPAA